MALRLWTAIVLLLVGTLTPPAHAADRPVEIRILEGRVERTLEIRLPAGTPTEPTVAARGTLRLEAQGNRLLVNGRPVTAAALQIGRPDPSSAFEVRLPGGLRRYPGMLRARAEQNRLILVNVTPLETYVAGVVSAEMPESWPEDTLKAQAVLARTLALKGGAHARAGLCDLTHCQAYAGVRTAPAHAATLATRGRVLTYRGALIQPLYHSTCGGERASNKAIFGGPALPYLPEGPDADCAHSPHAAPWKVRLLEDELARALKLPEVSALRVTSRSAGGYVTEVALGNRKMAGYPFWQALGRELGWGNLKSMRFEVEKEGEAYVFTGRGLGHGVGLCQWGARGRAARGMPYAAILEAYFPGTAIARR